jgi:NAD(P)-dependent dehydrogenase (short-subunit alcohol dehydrogenase family)
LQLKDKVVLITGAGKRLGAEMARALAERGARVAIHFRYSEEEARSLAEEIGGEVFGADLAEHAQVLELPGRVHRQMGALDVLVHSAAVFQRCPFGEVDLSDWNFHMGVNLRAPFFLTQEFVRLLPEGASGSLLFLSDARGDVLDGDFPSYSLSKAGIQSLVRGLAVSLAPRVRVLGLVLGQMMPVVGGGPPPPCDALIPGLAPSGTTGEAAVFLLGTGDFATGSLLYLDGGRHLRGGSRKRGTP